MYFSELFIRTMITVSLGIIAISVIVLIVLLIVDFLKKRVW
ncbi:MAG TPA: hypothetical protein VKZ75_00090 [Cyclobacteriaceae bacterium]|nr:hypothetical protein [Cyclobacteriaceae bacterium]